MSDVASWLGEMLLYTTMSLVSIVLSVVFFLSVTGRVNWRKIREDLSKIGRK